jgi:translation initiation factor 2 subunit 3
MNIGTLGHIDHGKTSITRAITHIWTDRHSESLKRNMTIKLGYADAVIRKCEKCEGAAAYTTEPTCRKDGSEAKPLFRISMLDAPGHETLMATAIAGASVIDAILFVIAANEPCPMQQTKEHLMIINLLGVKNTIIVQSKVDIVGREAAIKHYHQIKSFVKGSVIENAPVVPVMTNQGVNIDILLQRIAEMPKPERDLNSDPIMYVVRSFDVNKPGSDVTKLNGGVIGGAIKKGVFRTGDEIEIRPGTKMGGKDSEKGAYKPIITVITGISNGTETIDSAHPGGLIGLSTEIDPAFTKADNIAGNLVGHVGKLPESSTSISIKYSRIERSDVPNQSIQENESLILGVGTATVIGHVRKAKRDRIDIMLGSPICAEKNIKMAVLRNIAKRWRLTGYGTLV